MTNEPIHPRASKWRFMKQKMSRNVCLERNLLNENSWQTPAECELAVSKECIRSWVNDGEQLGGTLEETPLSSNGTVQPCKIYLRNYISSLCSVGRLAMVAVGRKRWQAKSRQTDSVRNVNRARIATRLIQITELPKHNDRQLRKSNKIQ